MDFKKRTLERLVKAGDLSAKKHLERIIQRIGGNMDRYWNAALKIIVVLERDPEMDLATVRERVVKHLQFLKEIENVTKAEFQREDLNDLK